MFDIEWTKSAEETFQQLKIDAAKQKRYKAVKKTVKILTGLIQGRQALPKALLLGLPVRVDVACLQSGWIAQ